jgi:hypothetical protein
MKNRSLTGLSFFFISVGLLLTLENFGVIRGVSRHWPALILILGSGFILLFHQRRRQDAGLLWIGSFLVLLGMFFYHLNFSSWWKLAHQWPMFLAIVGLSFFSTYWFIRKKIFIYMSIIFNSLFAGLYLVFGVALIMWPLSLIIFGLSLLGINYFGKRE